MGEEKAYAKLGLALDEKFSMKGYPFDFILWFALFKMLNEKRDRELKWLKDNREILEMMVKEYLEGQKLR